MARTSTTANAILGLLAQRERWSTWELAKEMRRNLHFFWPRAESRIYDELRRLREDGLVTAFAESVGRRRRTTYAISRKGRRRVDDWLAAPPRQTYLECEPLLRILLGNLADESALRAAVARVRADAEAISEVGDEIADAYAAGRAPFQEYVDVRALVFDFLARFSQTMRVWADAADAYLDERARLPQQQRAAAGRTYIERGRSRLGRS